MIPETSRSARAVLALMKMEGIGRATVLNSLDRLLGPLGPDELRPFLSEGAVQLGLSTADVEAACIWSADIISRGSEIGIAAISIYDGNYPERLRKIPDPPPVLFVKGSADALHADKVLAIVGTRQPSRRGHELSKCFARVAAEAGWVVVSGLALGCDTQAHIGSIEGGGSGVAVLAHGLDSVHPPENIKLAEDLIATGGCLVSEYPIGTLPVSSAFVRRDRLQSGLSDGVLIIEAGARGGAMHTARFARRQGRPVACLAFGDNAIMSTTAAGNCRLVEEGQALPVHDDHELCAFLQGLRSALSAPHS